MKTRITERSKGFGIRLEYTGAAERVLSNPHNIGRNTQCPCGSGKKFKRCHLGQTFVAPLSGIPDDAMAVVHVETGELMVWARGVNVATLGPGLVKTFQNARTAGKSVGDAVRIAVASMGRR